MISKYDVGMKIRKKVLGEDYLNKVKEGASKLDEPFQDLITQYAWGSVWSRKKLTKRERSLLTLVLLAAQGSAEEFRLHVNACKNTKTSPEDMIEAMIHLAIYAGVPKANSAIKMIKDEVKSWN